MTIHLPPDIERSIQAAVHGGHFASVDDAMTEAASLLLERLKHGQAQPPAARPPDAAQAHKPIWEVIADNRGGVTSLLRTHSFRQTGQFSMVFTASDVCGASPNQQALRTFCLLRASFPPPSF
jgi:Arc/MetJ-type ribon-helix-helix transcriptional regulator